MIVDLESSVWLICSYVIMKVRFHTPIQQNSKKKSTVLSMLSSQSDLNLVVPRSWNSNMTAVAELNLENTLKGITDSYIVYLLPII